MSDSIEVQKLKLEIDALDDILSRRDAEIAALRSKAESEASGAAGHSELLHLADLQAHARARYNEDDADLIRESKVIEWALRQAARRALSQ